jgi:3-hydroxyisobutyrate dehydrogenase-like beta-hydroxyacid dehydrogenase
MAGRLISAGYAVTVWNRTPSRTAVLESKGATAAPTAPAAVADADVVITMLSDPTAVSEVVAAIAPALRPGTTLIEASTIGPAALREVAGLLPSSVTLVDAPVMGSQDRAASGDLLLLVGGDLSAVRPILEVFGTVTHCGASGTGAALKVVVIGAVVAGVTVIAEAMALADALNLSEQLVVDALTHGPLAGIAGRAFAQGSLYQVRLAAKDVALATSTADLPVARAVHERLLQFPAAAAEDIADIVKHIRAQHR